MGPRRKPQASHRAHIRSETTQSELHVPLTRQQSIQDHFLSVQKSLPRPPQVLTQNPRSSLLLCYLQLGSMIPMIHGFDHATKSSPHSKHFNVPISMWAVINNGGYFCMPILQSSGAIWVVKGNYNLWIIQLLVSEISEPMKIAEAVINTSPSSSRMGSPFDYLKYERLLIGYPKTLAFTSVYLKTLKLVIADYSVEFIINLRFIVNSLSLSMVFPFRFFHVIFCYLRLLT